MRSSVHGPLTPRQASNSKLFHGSSDCERGPSTNILGLYFRKVQDSLVFTPNTEGKPISMYAPPLQKDGNPGRALPCFVQGFNFKFDLM